MLHRFYHPKIEYLMSFIRGFNFFFCAYCCAQLDVVNIYNVQLFVLIIYLRMQYG